MIGSLSGIFQNGLNDFNKPSNVTTDASNFVIRAVLSQRKNNSDLPIIYVLRTLNKAEKNYMTEKELLVIVWAVKAFRPYLYGRKFVIVIYHKPLWS